MLWVVVHALPGLPERSVISCPFAFTERHRDDNRTSQPSTSFMISFSRASDACVRLNASRSPSASNIGTRWMRDHAFSRSSSLQGRASTLESAFLHSSANRGGCARTGGSGEQDTQGLLSLSTLISAASTKSEGNASRRAFDRRKKRRG